MPRELLLPNVVARSGVLGGVDKIAMDQLGQAPFASAEMRRPSSSIRIATSARKAGPSYWGLFQRRKSRLPSALYRTSPVTSPP